MYIGCILIMNAYCGLVLQWRWIYNILYGTRLFVMGCYTIWIWNLVSPKSFRPNFSEAYEIYAAKYYYQTHATDLKFKPVVRTNRVSPLYFREQFDTRLQMLWSTVSGYILWLYIMTILLYEFCIDIFPLFSPVRVHMLVH